ncbi:sigma-70 family RNA polymerase sigma factor [Cohnella sp. REN36]|uniref:sigma-70 family RNA polymerase sigma factor n=1 Tax=Cohnella sp. REN36 TaxID=2887347 RepID=UPI001D14CFE8|nr:sigma-70 family RNA polymerase sigma factor [Cohnella sp. REN36]MCC3375816.1 sigma-70 family RNA polymerase sigma factor [Cohnella sp. REN36]
MDHPESELYRQLFYEHYPSVRRKLVALVRDDAAADDLAQEVFLRLYRNPPEDFGAIGAWLHRVLTRIGYDHMEKKARERALIAKQGTLIEEGPPPPSGEEVLLRRLDQEEVRTWLEELPERDRQALLLRYSGYSYAEIAEELQLRPPLVGTLLHRAAQKFRNSAGKRLAQSE